VLVYCRNNFHVVFAPGFRNVPDLNLNNLSSILAQVSAGELVNQLFHDEAAFVLH